MRLVGPTDLEANCNSKGRVKWKKLSQYDTFTWYQCILEPHLHSLKAKFSSSGKGQSEHDDAFYELVEIIRGVSDTLPHTCYKKHLKPYWNHDLSILKYRKVMSYRIWVQAGRPREPSDESFVKYKLDKNLFHKTLKRLSKKYKNSEIIEAVHLSKSDKNSFWKLIGKARKRQIRGVSVIKRLEKTVVHQFEDMYGATIFQN